MDKLAQMLSAPTAEVRLTRVRGSTPREEGTAMLVSADAIHGTIGGGQLEYLAIEEARALLKTGDVVRTLDVPLGPEIGQCCGGRVEIVIEVLDREQRAAALDRARAAQAARTHVMIFGAGHVGRALAAAMTALPVKVRLIDSRAAELALAPDIKTALTPVPEAEVRAARPGSVYVILTHDHSLDFMIAREVLARGDAAYAGMIGSETKRAVFAKWCAETGAGVDPAGIVCPIGAAGLGDKRPAVIAAFTAAEIMAVLAPVPEAAWTR